MPAQPPGGRHRRGAKPPSEDLGAGQVEATRAAGLAVIDMHAIALLLVGWLWLVAGPVDAAAAERLRASYGSISGSTIPIWVTKEAGLFEKHGLDVELAFIEGGAKAMAALVAGDVSIAQLGGSHVVSSHVAGSGVVILAGVVNILEYKVIVSKAITRPEQLRGKKAAVATIGGSGYLAMHVALKGYSPSRSVGRTTWSLYTK